MNTRLWVIIGIMATVIIYLLIKIYMLKKAAREIETAFADRLAADTNTLIDISCNDRHMKRLAASINTELRKLRRQRHLFMQGDAELKNAITNISHDLRTPLTAILGYLDLLCPEDKSAAAERYVGIITERARMLANLTEELFKYSIVMSNKENVSLEPVAINAVLEESIVAFYTSLCERGITPSIHMPEDPVIRMLDVSSLSRIFANLLNNVIKYSDGDLDIILTAGGEITFANTASELDEIQTGRLFDRFYTVNAAGKSTGLGLAIARTLVEQMNGNITAGYKNNRLIITILFSEK